MPSSPLLRISSNTFTALQYSLSAAHGRLSAAFAEFSALRRRRPPFHHFLPALSSLLSDAASSKASPQALQLHALILSLGLQEHSSLLPKIISFYAGLGTGSEARLVAEFSVTNVALAWNFAIYAYLRRGKLNYAVCCYGEMVGRGFAPNRFTYSAVLRVCAELRDLTLGRRVHCRMVCGFSELDVCAWNALVGMYAKCGDVDAARKVFDDMPVRDSVSWNSMLWGYALKGMWRESFLLLEMIPEGLANTITWNTILAGNLAQGNYVGVLKVISSMGVRGVVVDMVTMVIGLKACAKSESLELGKVIHGLAICAQCDGFENVVNALITMYCRCRDTNCAYMLFKISQSHSLVTWNAMISGFMCAGKAEEASLLFKEMVALDILPNHVTILAMISLCLRTSNLKHGQELHCFVIRHGMEDCHFLANSLIAMYSKVGKMTAAMRIFSLITYSDMVSYTALIAGYGLLGEGITSLKLLNEMIRSGISPDHIAMLAVLSACSHSRLVTQGQILFEQMVLVYGIEPRIEHFSCMVDLYCRVGLVRKAEELIIQMPLLPTTAMLATLIIACLIHANIEVGVRAAKMLLEMKSNNPSHYTIMLDMFTLAGCWQDLVKVKQLIRNMRPADFASDLWFESGDAICSSMAFEQSNPSAQDNSIILSKLVDHMRDNECTSDEDVETAEGMRWG